MSLYTTQLRWIVERAQNLAGVDHSDFTVAYAKLGLDSYPIFDEEYRQALNDKIISHFYFREIGFETAEQFAWFVRRTMNENMPYFNQLYNSLDLIEDPITNKKYNWKEAFHTDQTGGTTTADTGTTTKRGTTTEDVTDTFQHGHVETNVTDYGQTHNDTTTTSYGKTQSTVNGGADTDLEGATHERRIHSDTPMNQISNSGVESLNYASDVEYIDRNGVTASTTSYGGTTNVSNGGSDTQVNNGGTGGRDTTTRTHSGADVRTIDRDGTSTETGSSTGNQAYERDLDEDGTRTHNVLGYDGIAPADLLEKYRQSFLNVDLQVISSLETLFFGLWN